MIPAFLTGRLAGPIAAAIAFLSILANIGLGASVYFEKRANGKLTDRVVLLAGDLRTCQASNGTLQTSIKVQNGAVDTLKTAADLSAANAKLGQQAAEATAAAFDAKARALGKLPPLPAGADHCAAASDLIRKTLAGEHSK